jgi:MFS family permease
LAAVFYTYGYFQRVAPSVMVADLMREFEANAAALGNLSAFYFYPYTLLQIPLGMLIDRLGARRAMLAAAGLCTAGSFLFALAPNLESAAAGRMLVGIGASFSWIGTLSLAMQWLPAHRFATVTGLTLLSGLIGAVLAQGPLAALLEIAPWRTAMVGASLFMLAITVASAVVVRDRRPDQPDRAAPPGLLASLGLVVRDPQTWKVAIFTGFMVTPMAAFAGLWGVPVVTQTYDLDRPTAGVTVSLLLVGWAIGGPLAGWISDRLRRRKEVMATGGALVIACWVALLGLELPLGALQALLFANGLFSGAIILNFAAIRDSAAPPVVVAAMGLVNTLGMGCSALSLPALGYLLDLQWQGEIIDGVRRYPTEAYRAAFWLFPATMIVSLGAALLLRSGRRVA